ncbi:MAG TPA: hypothetical protein VET46_11325 [Steroidobacteraceae bacterium]|nr:hypothetical protein [Steroidobacteraceae bacterium]
MARIAGSDSGGHYFVGRRQKARLSPAAHQGPILADITSSAAGKKRRFCRLRLL